MSISIPLPRSAQAGMRLSVIEGCFAALPAAFSTGVFLTGFALLLGADAWALGLVAAIPAFGQSAQLLSAWLLGRWGHRKALTIWSASISRALWLAIAMIPFLPLAAGARLGLLFVLLGISTLLAQIAGMGWTDWMADVVPAEQRGGYFGMRNAVMAIATMAVVFLGSRWMEANQGHGAWGFLCLTLVGALGSAASALALGVQPEPAMRERQATSSFAEPLRDRRFLLLTLLVGVWNVVVNIVSPFCYPLAMRHMHVGYAVLGMHATIVAALAIVAQPLWGWLIDRRGSRTVMTMAMGMVWVTPLFWFALRQGVVTPIWMDAVVAGLGWPGVQLATFNLLIELPPARSRTAYMGVFNSATGIAVCLGSLIGGALMSWCGTRMVPILGGSILLIQLVFAGDSLGRLLCMLGVRRLLGRKAAPVITIETRPAVGAPAVEQELLA